MLFQKMFIPPAEERSLEILKLEGISKVIVSNPLSPNSDQHKISPCNINAYSTPEIMRIKDMITQGEFLDILR